MQTLAHATKCRINTANNPIIWHLAMKNSNLAMLKSSMQQHAHIFGTNGTQ